MNSVSIKVICIGGACMDYKYFLSSNTIENGLKYELKKVPGGVARNIAENLGRFKFDSHLFTFIGNDSDGDDIIKYSKPFVNIRDIETLPIKTSRYLTFIDTTTHDYIYEYGNMDICRHITFNYLYKKLEQHKDTKIIIVDLNVNKQEIEELIEYSFNKKIPLVLLPVSINKMYNFPALEFCSKVDFVFLNIYESNKIMKKNSFCLETHAQFWLNLGIKNIIITYDSNGGIFLSKDFKILFPSIKANNIKDVTGAGDAFVSAFLYGFMTEGDIHYALDLARYYSSKIIETISNVIDYSSNN